MASYNWGYDHPFLAGGNLSSTGSDSQYRFMRLGTTAGTVLRATGGSNPGVVGVGQSNPNASGLEMPVRILGTTQVYANSDNGGSAITFGCYLTAASDGQAICQGSISGSANAAAIALETLASGSGVLITALLLPYGVKVAAS
jgi:hypothetical protein